MKTPSNLVTDLRANFHEELDHRFDPQEVDSFFFILLEEYAGYGKMSLHLDRDLRVSESVINRFDKSLMQLKTDMPVQYITGRASFLGLSLRVNPRVLIPRPETEELVKWIMDDHSPGDRMDILDIGTGSGCIAIALGLYFRSSRVEGIDCDEGILATARENARANGVAVRFNLVDVFQDDDIRQLGKYDIIVSNPPYVLESERLSMKPNVRDFEPEKALFVTDDDPLIFYREILGIADGHLADGGRIYFEINERMEAGLKELTGTAGRNDFTFRSDLSGRLRMLRIGGG